MMSNREYNPYLKPPEGTVEERACQFLRQIIKERKLKYGDLAKSLSPPLSESQLRNLLKGGSHLTLDRFFQLAKIMQVDPLELLQSANPDPAFELPFSKSQEEFITEDPWHFKIMKALSFPRTEQELKEFFPDCPRMSEIVSEMLKREIILEEEGAYRVNASHFQVATVDFSEGFTEMLLKLTKEMHETTVNCERKRRDLIKYIRNMLICDYLTPEQMMSLRQQLLNVFKEFRRYVGRNRLDLQYQGIAKKNLVAMITLMAPLNSLRFLQGKVEN